MTTKSGQPLDPENKKLLKGLKRATLFLNCEHCHTIEWNVRQDNVLVCSKCGEINDYMEMYALAIEKDILKRLGRAKLKI